MIFFFLNQLIIFMTFRLFSIFFLIFSVHEDCNFRTVGTSTLIRNPRRVFWCVRTWPYRCKVWTFSIIEPVLFQGLIHHKKAASGWGKNPFPVEEKIHLQYLCRKSSVIRRIDHCTSWPSISTVAKSCRSSWTTQDSTTWRHSPNIVTSKKKNLFTAEMMMMKISNLKKPNKLFQNVSWRALWQY